MHLKTLSAFANSTGGELILGRDDKRNVVGIDNWEKLLEDIPSKIREKLGLTPSVQCAEIDSKKVIIVEIEPSQMPISYNGKYYQRSGSTTVEMSGSELAHFLISKFGKTWDALPSDANFEDIDMSTVNLFKNLARKRVPSISDIDSVEKVFTNRELLTEDGKITRAGLLLFGREPHRFLISAKTRVGRFKTSTTILDTVVAAGNLFNQVERTVEAIKKHLSVKFEIKGIVRQDIWDYPIEAIREAVINALIHKDYLSPAEIQIKVYDDKIWMWNPGGLPKELSIEDLKREHSSYPKNPLIANVFYLAGFIELWGSGTKRIVDLCKEQNLPEPDYKEEQGGFSVWLYKDIYTEEYLKELELKERQIKAVMYVKEKGKITNKEYQQINHTTRETSKRDLEVLVNKDVLKRRGKGRNVYYELGQLGQNWVKIGSRLGQLRNNGASKGENITNRGIG
ncbi:MAG: putative DNA binding domain-containing protein [Methanophagales archaeon]|nr:putative DNA binding domain-containing protein [Methanophagales archaeon]